jgi:hypothetical protein
VCRRCKGPGSGSLWQGGHFGLALLYCGFTTALLQVVAGGPLRGCSALLLFNHFFTRVFLPLLYQRLWQGGHFGAALLYYCFTTALLLLDYCGFTAALLQVVAGGPLRGYF